MEIRQGIGDEYRDRAAQIYWAAFEDKLGNILGPKARGVAFFRRVMIGERAFIAVKEDELIGIIGFDLGEGGVIGGGFGDLFAIYGFSAIWRGALLMSFSRLPIQKTAMIDGIAVDDSYRSKGVGSALLSRLEKYSQEKECEQIVLEVINTNPRARTLYTRHGFEVTGRRNILFFSRLFNFQSAIQMTKKLNRRSFHVTNS